MHYSSYATHHTRSTAVVGVSEAVDEGGVARNMQWSDGVGVGGRDEDLRGTRRERGRVGVE
jgi:hypothetical protein